MLTLYHHPWSTFSRRVRVALLEKGIETRLVEIDLAARRQLEPDYLARNPYGRVPTIEEDGLVLYESTAILEYLEATRPDPPLLPAGARDRARVAMHVKICDLEFAGPAAKIIRPKRFLPRERWRVDAFEKPRAQIANHLEILGRQLDGRTWLVGDSLTLAEICYLPFLQFLDLIEVPVPRPVREWAAHLLERPSALATRPQK